MGMTEDANADHKLIPEIVIINDSFEVYSVLGIVMVLSELISLDLHK